MADRRDPRAFGGADASFQAQVRVRGKRNQPAVRGRAAAIFYPGDVAKARAGNQTGEPSLPRARAMVCRFVGARHLWGR